MHCKIIHSSFYSDTNATRTQLQEMKTSLQATEVERDRLIELVGLLQKRCVNFFLC